MGRNNKGKRGGRGRAGRNAADLQPVPNAGGVETEATITGLEGGESVDEMLGQSVNVNEEAPPLALAPVDGEELAPASDEPGGGLVGGAWYERIAVQDEEDAVMTVADWSGYAQAAMAGGCEAAAVAVIEADELMHEQLVRQARLMQRIKTPE
jgi:hypothetical protein